MKAMGFSYTMGGIRQQPKPSNDEVGAQVQASYEAHLFDAPEKVKPEDIWNIDETACRLLPQAS
eukprot:5117373-Amphidinium_carterae.1